jgi:hypothetical protein
LLMLQMALSWVRRSLAGAGLAAATARVASGLGEASVDVLRREANGPCLEGRARGGGNGIVKDKQTGEDIIRSVARAAITGQKRHG